jgi:pimeloyl-ACP methyl ester carboxylesterase
MELPAVKIKVSGCHRYLLCVLAAAFLSLGCMPPPVTVPLGTVFYEAPGSGGRRLLVVFLPGNGDKPNAFERQGLLDALRKKGVSADVVGVNAHLGYYANGSIFRRLKEDVIDPAKAKGVDRIWLVGNSLGAYGSLAYLGRHPGDIAGVVLLGPFVGDRDAIEEVKKAGGLMYWEPGPVEPADWKKSLLLLLKDYEQHPDAYPPVYLGFGKFDKFVISQRFLAELLPPDHVIELTGGHEWRTWMRIWERFLDKDILK